MTDKRRSARIQGAWATKRPKNAPSIVKVDSRSSQLSDKEGQASTFTFQPTIEKSITSVIPEKVINANGAFDISDGPNGVSKIQLYCDFIEPDEAEWMFEQLQSEIPWQEKEITIFGKKMMQPRLTAWFGDFPYTYSRLTLKPFKWSPLLDVLRQKIEASTGLTFNSMLANLYRDNKDSVDWHSDDEKSLGKNPIIASLSFGDTRMFEMRLKPTQKDKVKPISEKVKVPLTSGSLLVMTGSTQQHWQHRVPKEYHDRNPRINLTFRTIHQK